MTELKQSIHQFHIGMVLEWNWNDIGMVLEWYWNGIGMVLE